MFQNIFHNTRILGSETKIKYAFSLYTGQYGYPDGNYMLKVNNRNTRTRCEICSKLTIKMPEQHRWRKLNGGWKGKNDFALLSSKNGIYS